MEGTEGIFDLGIVRKYGTEKNKSVKITKLSSNPESDLKTQNFYQTFWHFLLKIL